MTDTVHADLRPDEVELLGTWTSTPSRMLADALCDRIAWLVSSRLDRLASDATGWETLYRDPRDGRLWEHTFPQGETHGGGPPALRLISPMDAAAKYGVATV